MEDPENFKRAAFENTLVIYVRVTVDTLQLFKTVAEPFKFSFLLFSLEYIKTKVVVFKPCFSSFIHVIQSNVWV